MTITPTSMDQLRTQMKNVRTRLFLISNLVDDTNVDALRPLFSGQDEMIMERLMVLTKDIDNDLSEMQRKLNDAWSGKF